MINDGSTDNSAKIIYELQKYMDFTFVDLKSNNGKANALNKGIDYAEYDFVMGIDADTLVDDNAPYFMIEHFKKNPKLAAVTGNLELEIKNLS